MRSAENETLRFRALSVKELRSMGRERKLTHSEDRDLEVSLLPEGKWGVFLRAPQVFFAVLEKGRNKLVRLKDVAEIRFGIKTGANGFFHLRVLAERPFCQVCGQIHEEALTLKEEEELWKRRGSLPPDALVAVANTATTKDRSHTGMRIEWKGYIEARNLRLLAKEIQDLQAGVPPLRLFAYEGGVHAKSYLSYGEAAGVHALPAVSSRKPWWKLSPLDPPVGVVPEGVHREYTFAKNPRGLLIDKRLYGLFHAPPRIVDFMNTSLFKLSLEVQTRTTLGGGLADITVYEYKHGILLHPDLVPEDEVVDDDLVARVLGLTPEEKTDLALALKNLIAERLTRASRVKGRGT